MTPDDTWPCPAPSVLPRDGETLPSLDVLVDGETLPSLDVLVDRAIELDSTWLEDDES